jgi:electron transfer flavoprotein alpha subunit
MVVSDPLVNDHETPAGTLAAVSAAQKLHDGPISLLVVSQEAPTKIPAGVSHVLHVACNDKLAETVASAIWKSQQTKNFTHIVMSSSKFGSTVVPRAGALLNVAPVTDVLEIVPPGNLYIHTQCIHIVWCIIMCDIMILILLYATHTHTYIY